MRTKLSIVREHMARDEWREALRVAARFHDLGSERGAILDAHGAYTNPRFFSQLGRDLDGLKDAGRAALVRRYGVE